jgi:hypothetical protein
VTGPSLPLFDPFATSPVLHRLRNVSSKRVALTFPVFLALAAFAALSEGNFGGISDIQPVADVVRALGGDTDPVSRASFPLLRDWGDIFILAAVAGTCVIVHRQWVLMRACLPALLASGALRERRVPASNFTTFQRLCRYPALVANTPSGTYIQALADQTNGAIRRSCRFQLIPAAVAAVLTFLLVLGEQRNGLFRVFIPDSLTDAEAEEWLSRAYGSWWASTDHIVGVTIYCAIVFVGLYVVVIQNIVGVAAVYFLYGLATVAEYDADWLNRDGAYGWAAIGRAMQTVRWSLALHGATLSLGVFMLGVNNVPWVAAILAIWICAVPAYWILPNLLFKRVSDGARRARVEHIERARHAAGVRPDDLQAAEFFREAIERAHSAPIRPLQIPRRELPAYVVVILLPVVLAVAQTIVPLRWG